MNTTKNNILIAEFMGLQQAKSKNLSHLYKDPFNEEWTGILLYNINWNWLMLVVEKIETVKDNDFTVRIDLCNCMIVGYELYPQLHVLEQSGTKIEAVYNACVEFIKWYNKQK